MVKKKRKKKLKDGWYFTLEGSVYFTEVKNGKEEKTKIPSLTVLKLINGALEEGLRLFEEKHKNVKAPSDTVPE